MDTADHKEYYNTSLETFKLQSVMWASLKDSCKNRKVGKIAISILAYLGLSIVNIILFMLGLIFITLSVGFTPVTKEEILKKHRN